MNEKNLDFLKMQLKMSGFGEDLEEELREKLKKGKDFILLYAERFGKDGLSAVLHFKKSAQDDFFFFHKYLLSLAKENQEGPLQYSFYVDRNITLKEAYNLLDGRAIHKRLRTKDDQQYNAWLQLDFKNLTRSGDFEMKQYHQNYGFDLERVLSKYPIKELAKEDLKKNLLGSLQSGELSEASFLLNGEEKKFFITTNLAFKSIIAYDSNMQRLPAKSLIQKNDQNQDGGMPQQAIRDPQLPPFVNKEGKTGLVDKLSAKEDASPYGELKNERRQRKRNRIIR